MKQLNEFSRKDLGTTSKLDNATMPKHPNESLFKIKRVFCEGQPVSDAPTQFQFQYADGVL